MRALYALIAGMVFGLGLAVSQMTDPAKILAFLDVTGAWDPSLILVMAGALAVTALGYRLVFRRAQPLTEESFHLPAQKSVDGRLLAGAALFGIGWGLVGYCPGPAIASLVYLHPKTLAFVLAMVAGMYLHRRMTETRRLRSGA